MSCYSDLFKEKHMNWELSLSKIPVLGFGIIQGQTEAPTLPPTANDLRLKESIYITRLVKCVCVCLFFWLDAQTLFHFDNHIMNPFLLTNDGSLWWGDSPLGVIQSLWTVLRFIWRVLNSKCFTTKDVHARVIRKNSRKWRVVSILSPTCHQLTHSIATSSWKHHPKWATGPYSTTWMPRDGS